MANIMVGYDLGTYTFDASAQTVTFSGLGTVSIEQIRLITNVTDGVIIYNFASADKKGVIASNILTLDYDTTLMDNTDSLQIDLVYNNSQDYNLGVTKNSIQSADWGSKYTDAESLVTSQTLTTSFVDMGSEIQMIGYNQLGVRLTVDINDATDVEFRVLHKHESVGSEEYREVYLGASASNITTINLNDYQLGTDSNQLIKINIPFDGTTPYVQLQARMLTDGGVDAIISTAYITKAFAS